MISINWSTKVITIPQSYLTNLGGGLYELDTDQFRLDLKDFEDSEEGLVFPSTHNHVAPITLGGITLARIIEIINGYTITFENGVYAVNLSGSNNNISDVTNVNSVSIRSANSVGMVQVTSGSGLSSEQAEQLLTIYRSLMLDPNVPRTDTPSQIVFGDVTIDLAGDPEVSVTGTRQ